MGIVDEKDTATSAGTKLQNKEKTCGRELPTAGLSRGKEKDVGEKI